MDNETAQNIREMQQIMDEYLSSLRKLQSKLADVQDSSLMARDRLQGLLEGQRLDDAMSVLEADEAFRQLINQTK